MRSMNEDLVDDPAEASRLLQAAKAKKAEHPVAREDLCDRPECYPGCPCETMGFTRMLQTITDKNTKKLLAIFRKCL